MKKASHIQNKTNKNSAIKHLYIEKWLGPEYCTDRQQVTIQVGFTLEHLVHPEYFTSNKIKVKLGTSN